MGWDYNPRDMTRNYLWDVVVMQQYHHNVASCMCVYVYVYVEIGGDSLPMCDGVGGCGWVGGDPPCRWGGPPPQGIIRALTPNGYLILVDINDRVDLY